MANPTSALVPNVPAPVNVSNTAPAVQIIGANPQRNCLLINNMSANILWLGPSTVIAVSGTIQQGQFTLAVGATMLFGSMDENEGSGPLQSIPWVWTAAMFAIAASGATNAVTVWEW